jgi:hypothetical protein
MRPSARRTRKLCEVIGSSGKKIGWIPGSPAVTMRSSVLTCAKLGGPR